MFTAQSTPPPVPVTEPDPTMVELDDNGRAWFAELADATAARAAAEERVALARRNIEALLGDREAATVGGKPVVTWKTVASTRFDQAAAKELLTAEQFEACKVRTTSRRFVVID